MAKYLGRTQDQSGGTMRQQAFQESMDRITQGMGQLGGAIDKKRSTERQMALQDQSQREGDFNKSTQLSGKEITPDMVRAEREGTGGLNPNEMGPPAPSGLSAVLGGVLDKQETAMAAKSEKAKLDSDYKRAQISELRRKKSTSPKMGDREKLKLASRLRREESKLKKLEDNEMKKDPSYIMSKMGAEAKNKVGSIASGIQAISSMGNALGSGYGPEYLDVNTPLVGGLMSDTPYTKSERVLSEVIGRLQSGGAINKEEGKKFIALGPRASDSKEIALGKIEDQKRFLHNKLTAYGLDSSQLKGLGFDIEGEIIERKEGFAEETLDAVAPKAMAASPEEAYEKAKVMSKEEKIKFLGL